MDNMTIIAVASIVIAGITTGFGTMGPALAEGRAVATALSSLAQQPDASATITRTLFVGLAMIEAAPRIAARRSARTKIACFSRSSPAPAACAARPVVPER